MCHSPVLERNARITRVDLDTDRQFYDSGNICSPNSSRGHNCPSSASPYSSPVPLRCRAARLQQVTDDNSTLDLYVDGEQQAVVEPKKDSQNYFCDSRNDGYFGENKIESNFGRPPTGLSTAPSSPTYDKENLRTYSFREVKDFRRHLLTRDRAGDSVRPRLSHKQSKTKLEKLLQALRVKSLSKTQDFDSETTTTVEDIYVDSVDPQPTSDSSGTSSQRFTDFTIPYESDYSTEGPFSDRQSCSCEKGSMGLQNGNLPSTELLKQNSDEELLEKVKEVEHMLTIVSNEDLELKRLRPSTLDASALFEMTKNIAQDRRNLVLELSSQIKSRIAERYSTREGLKHAKFELDTRTRRLQQEKNELQSSLEKELDRRSTDWSMKLEKFQSEEQRLWERVRELAEQNVSLQREISSLKGNEEATRSRIINSEMEVNDLASSLEEARTENHNLHQALAELQERFKGAEEDLDCIRQNYKVKEKETKELQKVVVRLQKMCNEQDKTINGLRQAYSTEIAKNPTDRDEKLSRLQMEQVRLTGVELMLRKEVESCTNKLDTLRRDHISLLNRLRDNRNGNGFISVKLDQELRDRVDYLQGQALSLLTEHSQFFTKLLDLIKCKKYENVEEAKDFDGYLVGEYSLKYQSLRRGVENFRRSLLTVAAIADEKFKVEALECQSQTAESSILRQSRTQNSEDEVELELKAENLLTRLLREKLCSKELELEQLQSEFASSVRTHDVLQAEIQRLQDELSCLTHKAKDMELQEY
ncbi:cingulin-like protein 1 isoform X2 [Asparagus officinalis]|uniref:cingulin-like protein 1 isoform X2 n=1 Tax=Asparagus officinalis TaxID=4686 RepID=UPI00098E3E7F|nr:cingulin-like protein 1 isoform X2 [Asparagus officinalis]